MTDALISQIITGAATLLGGAVGMVGSTIVANRTAESARRRENFQIRREDYESRMRALCDLGRACEVIMAGTFRADDFRYATMIPRVMDLAGKAYDCLSSAAWLFPNHIRAEQNKLRVLVLNMDQAWDEARSASEQPAPNTAAVAEKNKCLLEEAAKVVKTVTGVRALAEKELEVLSERYRAFIDEGIPK